MAPNKRIKTLSALSRKLLSKGEDEQADFKRSPDGLSSEDLVAFANTAVGGFILVGVEEKKSANNAQIGVVCGCDISDQTILTITNKAVSCVPPVAIEITIENLNAKPILRISILPSEAKPHCTPKGIYCCRDGARNRPLHPAELLNIFLETEARIFAKRFEAAAERITCDLSSLEEKLENSIQSMADQLGWADAQLSDTESELSAVRSIVSRVYRESEDTSVRLKALFQQDRRDDPIHKQLRRTLIEQIITAVSEREDVLSKIERGDDINITLGSGFSTKLNEKEIGNALNIAKRMVRTRVLNSKYNILVKEKDEIFDTDRDKILQLGNHRKNINKILLSEIDRVDTWGIIFYGERIVGTIGFAQASEFACANIFQAHMCSLSPKNFNLELRCLYLLDRHKNKGQMNRAFREVFSKHREGAFAVVNSNEKFKYNVLLENNFIVVGREINNSIKKELCEDLLVRSVRW